MRKITKLSVTTEEGIVLSENLLTPDTPESRTAFQKFARNNYRVTLGFPKNMPKVVEWVESVKKDAVDLLVSELDVSPEEAANMFYRRFRDGDAVIEQAKKDIERGRRESQRVPTEYAGLIVLPATSKNKPLSISMKGDPLTEKDVYRGMFGVATIALFAYDNGTVSGLGAWLDGFVKTRDGEPLGRSRSPADLLAQVANKVHAPVVDDFDDL